MAGLALLFYETALEFTEGMAAGRLLPVVKYPAAVIMLVSTSLDASINEYLAFMHMMELEPTKKSQLQELRKEKKLRRKWIRAPDVLSGVPLDRCTEPYLSFDLMLTLRNKLVHEAAGFYTPSEYPLAKIDEYRKRFAFTYAGTAHWTSQVLNLECARWGCRTSKQMIETFHSLTGIKQFYPWPDAA
ncbi:MAG: hypothetical protein WBQ34_07220 [Candidatus Acidiferrales bacterium]